MQLLPGTRAYSLDLDLYLLLHLRWTEWIGSISSCHTLKLVL